MKKSGFTLMEILVSLAIIGIIAALTLPTLTGSGTNAQTGPKLAKAMSTLEQALKTTLQDNDIDSIQGLAAVLPGGIADLPNALSDHMYLNPTASNMTFIGKDGTLYIFMIVNVPLPAQQNSPINKQYMGQIGVDINGNARPNQSSKDIFFLALFNDGSIRPVGGTNWDGGALAGNHWSNIARGCPNNAVPTDASLCAGSIFENNLKVMYK